MNVSGTCPGNVTFDFTGFTPNSTVQVGSAPGAGNYTLPSSHTCGGLETGLAPGGRPRFSVTSDAAGSASYTTNIRNAGACGATLQAVDWGNCTTSNVLQGLP